MWWWWEQQCCMSDGAIAGQARHGFIHLLTRIFRTSYPAKELNVPRATESFLASRPRYSIRQQISSKTPT